VDARHRFAAAAHDGEQGLDAVDSVPEEIGMVRLQSAGSVLIAPDQFAQTRIVADVERLLGEPERRT
jgi:hypothetical protein